MIELFELEGTFMDCCSLAVASNKVPCSHSITPPPTGAWRRMERKR